MEATNSSNARTYDLRLGNGQAITYSPLPNGQLPPGEVAILFLARFGNTLTNIFDALGGVDNMRYDDGRVTPVTASLTTGIGADGVVLLGRTGDGSPLMRYYNADGSRADLCGNATLCVTAWRRMPTGFS